MRFGIIATGWILRGVGVLLAVLLSIAPSDAATTFRIGFFEGGPYPAHAELRNQYREQLKAMVPDGYEIVFAPDGFKSGDWNRDSSRLAARDLASNKNIDLVLALGPWTVEDLLAAGFDRPIVAALRFDPILEGLADNRGRPIVDNLTVRLRPGKMSNDLQRLSGLAPVKNIGFLYFPSGDESDTIFAQVAATARSFGLECTTAAGYDRNGTYAFFKAYRSLGKVDAVYLPPLWGCNNDKIKQFYVMLARDQVIAFSSEGSYQTQKGALASGSAESALEEAHSQAWKTIQIMKGNVPADLPVRYPDIPHLTVNESVANQLGLTLHVTPGPDISVIEGPASDDVERLTVVDAASLALTQNHSLQAARSRLDAAREAIGEATSGYLPQLEATADLSHHGQNSQNNYPEFDRTRYRAGLELRQELFSRQILNDIRTSHRQADLVKNEAHRAALDLELAVTGAFLDVYLAEQLKALGQLYLAHAQKCLRLAGLRLALGEGKAPEVWRLEEEASRAAVVLRGDVERLRIARVVLNELLGRPGDYPFVIDWQHFADSRFLLEVDALRQAMVEATKNGRSLIADLAAMAPTSPELDREDLRIALGESDLARNRADWWPRIGFVADLNLTDELAEREGWNEASPTWSVGATVNLPLFEGGRRMKRSARLRAELDALRSRRDQTSLKVASNLHQAFENLSSRADQFSLLARAAQLAKDYLPTVESDYAAGIENRVVMIDALTDFRRAGSEALGTQIEYFLNVARMLRIAGMSANEWNRSPGDQWIWWLTTPRH